MIETRHRQRLAQEACAHVAEHKLLGAHKLDAALPDVATQVRSRIGERNVKIELSLRRVEHVDTLPELAAAWKLDGVVLEFQSEGRGDHELDARGLVLTHPVDDHDAAK